MQQRPAETAASALRAPSVIHSGTAGSPSAARAPGGTSRTIGRPAGVSYFTGLPPARRGVSGRYWWRATPPVTPCTGTSRPGTGRWARAKPSAARAPGAVIER